MEEFFDATIGEDCQVAISLNFFLRCRRWKNKPERLFRQFFWTCKNFVGSTTLSRRGSYVTPRTNFSWQDELWAEFSTLEVAACNAMHFDCSIAICPNLELKTWPKQLLGSLLLDVVLPATLCKSDNTIKRQPAQQGSVIMLSVAFYLPSCCMS